MVIKIKKIKRGVLSNIIMKWENLITFGTVLSDLFPQMYSWDHSNQVEIPKLLP